MFIEIAIAAALAVASVYILYKNIKKSASGKCSGCSYKSEGCSCCAEESKK